MSVLCQTHAPGRGEMIRLFDGLGQNSQVHVLKHATFQSRLKK